MANLVAEQIEEWKQTLWAQINTEAMEEHAKQLQKDVKALNRKVRIWDCYTGLEGQLKNFLTILPIVGALSSKAMRPRHWKQVMQTTGVTFST